MGRVRKSLITPEGLTPKKIIIGDAILYQGNCLDILPVLNNQNIDTLITDPPYGINYKSPKGNGLYKRGDYPIIDGDEKEFDPSPFLNFKEVVMFGANHFSHKLPASRCWLIWDKRDGLNSNNNSDCEIVWKKTGGSARLIHHRWNGMIKASEKDQKRVHPTQKPIAVMQWIIKQCNNPRVILDPFMGSGTTGVACINLGLKFIGIEINEKYFDIACERIEKYQQQLKLIA